MQPQVSYLQIIQRRQLELRPSSIFYSVTKISQPVCKDLLHSAAATSPEYVIRRALLCVSIPSIPVPGINLPPKKMNPRRNHHNACRRGWQKPCISGTSPKVDHGTRPHHCVRANALTASHLTWQWPCHPVLPNVSISPTIATLPQEPTIKQETAIA